MRSGDEVIVIGSGPCGAIAAATLTAQGVPVVVLDAGLRPPRGALLRVAGKTLIRMKSSAELAERRLDAASAPDLLWTSSLSLGGLSNYWTSAVPRYAPDDFTHGGDLDRRFVWPVTYDELAPFYDQVEDEMGLTAGAPINGVPSGRAVFDSNTPQDWQAVACDAQAAGHSVGPMPMARGRPTMFAWRGTEYGSYHCTVARLESSPNFRLVTGALVLRLNWNPRTDRVDSVDYVDRRTGLRRQIKGRAVVLAAGTIDSTVIVLRSTSPDFPNGLGNSSDLVGRYLHDHPRQWWMIETDRPLSALAHPVCVARAPYSSSAPLMGASMMLGGTPGLANRLKVYAGGKVNRFGVQVLGTMIPEPELAVSVGEWDGARPSIQLRYDEAAEQNMADNRDRLVDVLGDAGVQSRTLPPYGDLLPGQSIHYAGTIRMHADPEFGVLDRWNRMYDVRNVAVVDPSCFPTGPEKNPTLTAMAVAARAAHRLADDLSGRELA